MVIRNGDFGKIGKDEYQIFKNEDGSIDIVTKDNEAIKKGFQKDEVLSSYYKTVRPEVMDCSYRVYTKGNYKNEKVNISNERDNKVLIGTTDASIAKSLGLDRTDKYYYEKWVPIEEVNIFEEKRDIIL